MFENGSFLRRRKRFKLQKCDKDLLERTLGSFSSSSSSGGMNHSQLSPSAASSPSSLGGHNGISGVGGMNVVPSMNMSPPIPGMMGMGGVQFSSHLPHHLSSPAAAAAAAAAAVNGLHGIQFGGLPPYGSHGAPHPMFLGGASATAAADARILAAAAAGYSPPRDMFHPHSHPHHHPHAHPNGLSPAQQGNLNHLNSHHFNHGSGGALHPAYHHQNPAGQLAMTPKDIEDLKEATLAIKCLREQSAKLKRANGGSMAHPVPIKRPYQHLIDEDSAKFHNNNNIGVDEKDRLVSPPESPPLTKVKRRGGSNNSNNFSIENLIAKDKQQQQIKETEKGKVITNGKHDYDGDDDDNGDNRGGRDSVLSDSVSISVSDVGSEDARLDQPSDLLDEDDFASGNNTTTKHHHHHSSLCNNNDTESVHSAISSLRSNSPAAHHRLARPESRDSDVGSHHSSGSRGNKSHVSTSPKMMLHNAKHLLSSATCSTTNASPTTTSPHLVQSSPNFAATVSAASLLPAAYPFYAAAFLSAQSILQSHHQQQQHQFNLENNNNSSGAGGGGSSPLLNGNTHSTPPTSSPLHSLNTSSVLSANCAASVIPTSAAAAAVHAAMLLTSERFNSSSSAVKDLSGRL